MLWMLISILWASVGHCNIYYCCAGSWIIALFSASLSAIFFYKAPYLFEVASLERKQVRYNSVCVTKLLKGTGGKRLCFLSICLGSYSIIFHLLHDQQQSEEESEKQLVGPTGFGCNSYSFFMPLCWALIFFMENTII